MGRITKLIKNQDSQIPVVKLNVMTNGELMKIDKPV